ncbi:MAG: multidrug efflux SMR transporter [Methylococcaceae bacterium]|nr:multidrug efflux SMR transporter [Methylococcaceae bacterium]
MREGIWGWIFLAGAIGFELAGTTTMKVAHGFSQFWPSVLIFACYGLSITALTFALKYIELGIAYAVWAGLGTALLALIGVVFFRESIGLVKVLSIALIIVGVVGLNLVDTWNRP